MAHETRLDLVGTHEIRVLLGGISRQRVHQLTSHPTFPAPLAELGQGRCWSAAEVERWIAEHRSHPPTQPEPPRNAANPRRVAALATSRKKQAQRSPSPSSA